MKKWIIGILVVTVVGALGFWGYQSLLAPQAMADTPAEETAIVRRGTLLDTISATGSLAPHTEVAPAFTSGGLVAEVLVEEGQQIEAGQPLVRLNTDDLELQVAQTEASLAQVQAGARAEDIAAAEASLRSAQANYDKVAAGSRPEDIAVSEASLRGAQANYDRLVAGLRPEEVAMAQADLAKAEAAVRRAQADYDKVAGHPRAASMPQALALEQATQDYEKALASYQLQLNGATPEELAASQAQVDQAAAQLEKLQNSPTTEELAVAQAQLDQAAAQLEKLQNGPTTKELATAQVQVDQARLRLEQATLTAPIDGTVTALGVQPGEMASPGQVIVVLSDLAVLEVEVNLDETDVVQVAVGQEARISLDAFPGVEMAGEVTYVAPVAETLSGVVLYPVTVQLTQGAPSTDSGQALPVRAGMTADVEIVIASQEDALIVPLRAVKTEGERAYVDRLVGGQMERVEVELGLMADAEIEIVGNLAQGDVVVVVPSAQGSAGRGPGMFGALRGGE